LNGKFHKFVSFYRPYLGLFCADLLCAGAVSGIALLLPLGARYITQKMCWRATSPWPRVKSFRQA